MANIFLLLLVAPTVSDVQGSNHSGDADLFSFLSAMHLSQHQLQGTQQLITSRKRKILDHGDRGSLGGSRSEKFNGLRPPALRRNSDDDLPLHTPQCSQSGKRQRIVIILLEYFV